MPPVIISLCDLTGNFVQPWVDKGYHAFLVDPQHTQPSTPEITRFKGIIEDALPEIGRLLRTRKIAFVGGFPPCTNMAVSGARWFAEKIQRDPYVQGRAFMIAEQCRTIAEMSGAPYLIENPRSILSNVFGPADHAFHPWQYTAYEANDNYTKYTNLWTGGGFKMPKPAILDGLGEPDNRIHFASPGPERGNIRSATPMGFARAVFEANGVSQNGLV